MTNRLLSNYCQILFPSTDYMKELSTALIEELSDGKDDLKANSDALMEQTNKFLNSVIKSFSNMPGFVHVIHITDLKSTYRDLYKYLSTFNFHKSICGQNCKSNAVGNLGSHT